jgi:AraC-like DNA-binding protein
VSTGQLRSLHAFQAPLVASSFQFLRIGASLFDGENWFAIHAPLNLSFFELAHGKSAERHAYNTKLVKRVFREKKTVLAEYAGHHDFFVPVGIDRVESVLISGPFATARPTSAQVLERWRWLTGRHGHPSDPEFAHYLSMTLGTLTLEPAQVEAFRRLLEGFASLIAGRGDPHALSIEARELTAKVEQARFVEWAWDVAREMIDERTARVWVSPQMGGALTRLGLKRLPEHVLVGLTSGRSDNRDVVGAMFNRDRFQRACIDLARRNHAVGGRVGEHGVMFLVVPRASGAGVGRALAQLGDRAIELARRGFDLDLHVGSSSVEGSASLGERYQQALAAAELALSQARRFARADARPRRAPSSLRALRRTLGATQERPLTLPSRFERYMEAVAIHSGYRMESARAHLEAGFDEAADALFSSGILPEKSYLDMCDALENAARDALTASDLFAAYRRAIADLVDLAERPVRATQDRSLRRAVTFIHQHFAEPMALARVARVAGFAPSYFSQLFKRREKMNFENYVNQLRIEHAKELLGVTDLSLERVGQLSGFPLRSYFHRVFKRAVGTTPAEYRRMRPRPGTPDGGAISS